ncbi:hypothetical protein [Rhodococcoides trifolii]|uniref:hypothetical protein n=1 Tax=Rhodococcoides trifolii TaxID=908250 RepID=UPI001663630A|nr:hypothetical protein [Rhodococcus trifolii]
MSVATVAALTFDGFLSAVVAALFLPLYAGSTPFPISALAAGALNVVLVRSAMAASGSIGQGSLPLVGFFVGLVLCALGGPGGDVILLADWRAALLLVAGVAPPAVLLYSARIRALTRG